MVYLRVALYCPYCMIPVHPKLIDLAHVKLPISVDIIHHPQEKVSKSTGLHARVMAPEYVRFLRFPQEVPEYDPASTVLVFPDDVCIALFMVGCYVVNILLVCAAVVGFGCFGVAQFVGHQEGDNY